MSLVGFQARNHVQQVRRNGARPEVDDRALPMDVFAPWHKRFRFTVDAAALPHNAKLPRFWTPEDDGLAQSWTGERVYCNPPHSNVAPWLAKAWQDEPDLAVLLIPANRTEQSWWHKYVEPYRDRPSSGVVDVRVEFLAGRLRFIAHDDTEIRPNARPPYGCCLVIFRTVAL